MITYLDENGPLVPTVKTARCRNIACTSSGSTTVDETGKASAYTSTTIGVDGLPLIAYPGANGLRVAHCSNVFCVPYFRRR